MQQVGQKQVGQKHWLAELKNAMSERLRFIWLYVFGLVSKELILSGSWILDLGSRILDLGLGEWRGFRIQNCEDSMRLHNSAQEESRNEKTKWTRTYLHYHM